MSLADLVGKMLLLIEMTKLQKQPGVINQSDPLEFHAGSIGSQQGVPIGAGESFTLSQTDGSGANTLFIASSLLEGDREGGESDVGEERVEVAAVEAEEDEEELPSGRHSSQQQQQQSMKAWPRERHRHSSSSGVEEHRTNSRNCPIRPSAGRTRAGSAADTAVET